MGAPKGLAMAAWIKRNGIWRTWRGPARLLSDSNATFWAGLPFVGEVFLDQLDRCSWVISGRRD